MVLIEREIEKEVEKWIDEPEIIAIRGPRQSGKTTLLNQIRDDLIHKGVNENQIHYFTFEDDSIRLKFQADCIEFIRVYADNRQHYFLLDEVQYVNDAGKHLKLIFDSFKNIKLVITGSSSFDLTNLGKWLVGRILFFNLCPFSFSEFLRAKGERYERLHKEIRINIEDAKLKETVFIDELNKLLHEYLTYGAYPRIVLEQDKGKKKELLKNLFLTYIEKDIVSLYGKKYRDSVVKLLKTLSSMAGNVVNYETLAVNSGLKYTEVRRILPLLEDSFVISIVKPFHKNLITELRKNPKIYFIDCGIRNYLLENFENLSFDHLYENFIYNELRNIYKVRYWRTTTKTEVDFVIDKKELVPVEVKTSAKITRALRSFIAEYSSKTAFVANLREVKREEVDGCSIIIVPFVYF